MDSSSMKPRNCSPVGNKLDDLSKLVPLYALVNKLRLFAPSHVVSMADGS